MICPNCNTRKMQKHRNSKWCLPCADGFRKRPKHTLTLLQIREVKKRLHKMPKAQICEEVGCSWSSLGRWASGQGIRVAYYNRWASNPKLVNQVCQYYSKHGKRKTIERFPDINFRSLIERYYTLTPRQTKWSEDQLIELTRMAGLISIKAQAKYFDRPRANEGSIVSVWMKTFKVGGGCINGPAWYMARPLVTKRCKPIQTKFWRARRPSTSDVPGRKVVLWVDFHKHLKPGTPKYLRDTAKVMAKFQVWLYGTHNVRAKVRMMMKQREL